MFEMVAPSGVGRSFSATGRVRLGDASPGGRLRCDAMARYLQDVSDDDTRDAGLDGMTWVVRRTVLDVHRFPRYLETFRLVTWCAGLGSRWAERRTSLVGDDGGHVEAATLWVALDPATRRPARPPDEFVRVFGPSAAGRTVSSKLLLPAVALPADELSWTPRFSDFDVMGHVNNAVSWEIVEQLLADTRDLRAPLQLVVEYDAAFERDREINLVAARLGTGLVADLTMVDPPNSSAASAASPGVRGTPRRTRIVSISVDVLVDRIGVQVGQDSEPPKDRVG